MISVQILYYQISNKFAQIVNAKHVLNIHINVLHVHLSSLISIKTAVILIALMV